VVVVALYPTNNTTNKEKIERHCREKRWNWIEFSCRPGVLYITTFLSNNNITHTQKEEKKEENRQRKEIYWLLRNRIYVIKDIYI
jgi:hypothetical protein